MDTVIFDQTPLAEYLRDEGEEGHQNWVSADTPPDTASERSESPCPSFAPRGRPILRGSFRNRLPTRLQIHVPPAANPALTTLHDTYSKAVNARMDPADSSKFLEQFRYTIVASQLLRSDAVVGQQSAPNSAPGNLQHKPGLDTPLSTTGVLLAVASACIIAWFSSWVYQGGISALSRKRTSVIFVFFGVIVFLLVAHAKRQRLRHLRDQALTELSAFVSTSQDFDSATGAAIALIQEVEVVSRGYRLSTPLPPISRLDDNGQSRRCVRLRKALRTCFADVIPKYQQAGAVTKGFAEQLDLEKYYDIYEITDLDISDADQPLSEADEEDAESLRILRISQARFHTIRKTLLCALLAYETTGDESDYLRWSTTVEGLRMLTQVTKEAYTRVRRILSEEEMFQVPPTPKMPLTPGREKWRSQLRNINSLSTGIRGLQAKLHLLREESDRTLNEADTGVSQLGSNLMSQYDSIGVDLKALMQAWEDGKTALASGIDRHEKRVSSMSAIMSPASSLSGLTTVEEGGALEALKTLNGESPSTMDFGSPSEPDTEQVFEAVALPRQRPRSMFTREERITKMREERSRKETARQTIEANQGMLRELEMVIHHLPKTRREAPGRVSL
ncbi:hypothetical protein MKZ38_002506 [Zalerion maritima]|uniref:Vezatin n=1 Tax=Zalerion maritima TaxID=339359 RepID=A0AAD5RPU8_9PEZI|nr:hypothetical protein MKZ38_002506 [Zalerion maritima]